MTAPLLYLLHALVPQTHSAAGAVDTPADVMDVLGVLGGPVARADMDGLTLIYESGDAETVNRQFSDDMMQDMAALEAVLMAQQAIMARLWAGGVCVPFRFGTVVNNLDDLKALISVKKASVQAAFDAVAGHAEIGVQIIRLPDTHPPQPSGSKDMGGTGGPNGGTGTAAKSGRDYLRALSASRKSEAAKQQSVDDFATQLMDTLAAQSADHQSLQAGRPTDDGGMVAVNHTYLVADSDLGPFQAVIAKAGLTARDIGYDVRMVGPMPPQSFAHADLSSNDLP